MTSFELADLNKIVLECRQEYQNLPNELDIKITEELRDILRREITVILSNGASVEFSDYSITYKNRDNLVAILPSRWLWIASVFQKYASEYFKYSDLVIDIKERLKLPKEFLKEFPKNAEPVNKTPDEIRFEKEIFQELQLRNSSNATSNYNLVKKFLYERTWWNFGSGKTLDRADAYDSTLLGASQVIAASSDKLVTLITAFARSQELREEFEEVAQEYKTSKAGSSEDDEELEQKAQNIIYYGAPGTGKSHDIDKNTKSNNSVRTVFHPETQYSDFVGCLRPSMGEDGIEYNFKSGPFIEALIKAFKDPENRYYLIIEEINRAPAAAVFGELFQLLDRDNSGKSKYSIDINDKDLLKLLNAELPGRFPENKLYIPDNLSLYATMNSSDQAVMPMDTAFKRRWKFKYKPLDFSEAPTGNFNISFSKDTRKSISWKNFATAVNTILSQEGIPEDRHLGPWFVNVNEIKEPKNAQKTLTGKILMYLWDDVLRHTERSKLFYSEIKTFGLLIKKLENNEVIFSEAFLKKLEEELESNPQNTKDESLKLDGVEEDTAGEN
ncbi:AAA family ATPase [Acinetobacter baumannii]|uniref:McrB family protein n=1 Tax=Acinetobacter baumannii TaxID=470 RepID=UPI0013B76808|nr:AAA family ATPase [Acinetobacter baumannii]MDA4968858.1 AAA family ATPase [Acinetobacter baumannii]NDX01674.1 AAA domain-containing protein [Acinetobacter baumannii]HAV5317757.1 type II restriction endonuclease subunit R [Acinetobacter baumannii]